MKALKMNITTKLLKLKLPDKLGGVTFLKHTFEMPFICLNFAETTKKILQLFSEHLPDTVCHKETLK